MICYKILSGLAMVASQGVDANAKLLLMKREFVQADTVRIELQIPILFSDTIPKPKVQQKTGAEAVFCGINEQQPEYPGGTKAMYEFIKENLKTPRAAKRAGISGRVFVSFFVETTGELTEVTVLKGLGFGCDDEAVRLIESMPKWKPGKREGKVVRVKYTLPISFVTNSF